MDFFLKRLVEQLGSLVEAELAVPVLAGSAAYGLGEAFRWRTGLARKPMKAKAFYGAITVATILGALLNFSGINPIDALYWSAVLNGLVAVPIMAVMMLMSASTRIMGDHGVGAWLRILGWLAALVMALCAAAMLLSLLLK